MNISDYVYGTNDLVGVIEDLKTDAPPRFLLSLFFSEVDEQETESIHFDRIAPDLRIAPFVSPKAKATARAKKGYSTDVFNPAYIKLKDGLSPSDLKKRLPGEPLGGSLSAEQRAQAHIGNLIGSQRNATRRRLEVMAAETALNGSLTIAGDDYPAVTVDYSRDAAMVKSLSGAAEWDQVGVSPVDDLDGWLDEYAEKNNSAATDVVFDAKAWGLFKQDAKLEKLLDRTLGQQPVVDLGFTKKMPGKPVYKGNLGGVDLWVYNDTYEDVDGTTKSLLPDYTVIIGSPAVVEGVQAFGMIEDFESLEAMDMFSKTWLEKDPSELNVLTQSAPLLVPRRPNGLMRATVKQP